MNRQAAVHIQNRILLSHKKEGRNVICTTWMDVEMIILSEIEKEKYHVMPCCLVAQSCMTICHPTALQAPLTMEILQARTLTGVGSHALLQGIFPAQGSSSPLHWQAILYY